MHEWHHVNKCNFVQDEEHVNPKCFLCKSSALFHNPTAPGNDKKAWRCETCFIPIALQQDDV